LTLAEPEGYQRIFLDEEKSLIKLLVGVRKLSMRPQLNDMVNRLLEAYSSNNDFLASFSTFNAPVTLCCGRFLSFDQNKEIIHEIPIFNQ